MKARPLAVYVSPSLSPWLGELGMEVEVLHPEPGILDLKEELDRRGIVPDVIIQDEVLAPRTLLKGLEALKCPKLFWAQDPHLNHYWQAPYCALFDAVACTQKAWLEPLARAGAGASAWVTWCAMAQQWRPHDRRGREMAFVGRVTEFRPLRQLFAKYLGGRFPLRLETDIAYDEVQPVYMDARLAPNESIGGEITQRLFLAAGAGCLVLEPDRDNGLEELFLPGREVAVYGDALELASVAKHFLAHPAEAERMGRAALERCRADHQPANRVRALGRLARDAAPRMRDGAEADRLFWLAAARCLESSLLTARPEEVVRGLAAHHGHPDCATALLRLLAAGGEHRQALEIGTGLAASGFAPGHAEFAACVCALALKTGQTDLAFRLFEAFARHGGDPLPQVRTPAALYAALGEALARRDLPWRPGFPFDQERHVPASALEMYHLCLCLEPDNQPVLKKAEALLRGLPGSGLTRLNYLSELSLRNREDFRLGLSLGLTDLQAYRVEEGLEEIRLARLLAAEQGKLPAFDRLLALRDRRGFIRAALRRF